MPRIRNIKPEFFDDEGIGSLSPLARLCFIGLWTQADREGRLEDRPDRLKVRLFPYEKKLDMPALISELCAEGCISRYNVNGSHYLLIRKFKEHQYLSKREPESSLPSPNGCDPSTVPVLDRYDTGTTDIGHRTRDNGQGTVDSGHVAEATALAVTRTNPDALMRTWNESVTRLPKASKMTPERRRHCVSRLQEEPSLTIWRNAFVRLEASDFACGVAGGWRADFDFVLKAGTLMKVLEGKYDNRAPVWGAGKTAGNPAALAGALAMVRKGATDGVEH
jgi:hypothetical protein